MKKINNKRLEIISPVLITRRRCRVRPRRKFQLGGDECDNGRWRRGGAWSGPSARDRAIARGVALRKPRALPHKTFSHKTLFSSVAFPGKCPVPQIHS